MHIVFHMHMRTQSHALLALCPPAATCDMACISPSENLLPRKFAEHACNAFNAHL